MEKSITIYESPIGLGIYKHEDDDYYLITGNVSQKFSVRKFDGAYEFEKFAMEQIDCINIQFDSEYSQFFAYAKRKEDARRFVNDVEHHFSLVRDMLNL